MRTDTHAKRLKLPAAVQLKRHSGGASASDEGGDIDAALGQETHKQLSSLKDRNRLAQRKYRQRRKEQIQSSEERLAYLEAQVEALSTDKESLRCRNVALEDYLLRQHAELQQRRVRGTAPEGVAKPSDSWLDDHTRSLVEDVTGLAGVDEIVLTAQQGHPQRLPLAQLLEMPPERVHDLVKQYINAMAECYLGAEQDPESDAGKRLALLVRESSQLKGAILLRDCQRPEGMYLLGSTFPVLPGPPPDMLRSLVVSARLSDGQAATLLRMRKLYCNNLGALTARRRDLLARLTDSTEATAEQLQELDLELDTVVSSEAVRDTLRSERMFALQLQMLVWFRVLTPLQTARALLQMLPSYKLDVLIFLNALAVLRGDALAPALLEQGQSQNADALLPMDVMLHAQPLPSQATNA